MWIRFPLIALRENRLILSEEELKMRLDQASKCGKSCEVGIYSFEVFNNSKPVVETVILDKIVLTGKKEALEKIAEKKFKEGYDCLLLFDGKSYFLFIKQPLEKLEDLRQIHFENAKVITNPLKKIVYPGYVNLRTGKVSKVLRRWKHGK